MRQTWVVNSRGWFEEYARSAEALGIQPSFARDANLTKTLLACQAIFLLWLSEKEGYTFVRLKKNSYDRRLITSR